MMKFILPIIFVGLAIAGFIIFVGPQYQNLGDVRMQVSAYNEALKNSKRLESERDKLTAKYNSIDPANIERLEKFLPNSVDNIRLILEIEKIALPYGMALRDVKYDIIKKEGEGVVQGGQQEQTVDNKDYGTWELSFSTQSTYSNFISFIKDLERNLRVVDISSVQFASDLTTAANPGINDLYRYTVKIKTYWLKN